MNPDARAALDAICQRALRRSLDESPPVMVEAVTVVEAVFAIAETLGPLETDAALPLDDAAEAMIRVHLGAACKSGGFAPLRILKPFARDELRLYVRMVTTAIQLMAEQGLDYGPVPHGLQGRDLGFAALAIEILEARSPQRLIAQQRRAAH